MCGIFGYVGKEQPSVTKIKILGIYNQSRGEDACGIFINNQVLHGNADKKTWKKFIEGTYLTTPTENNTIIAHTRKASSGGVNVNFTHPYSIFTNKQQKYPKLVGVHNGTITNWNDLKTKHNVEGELNDSKTLFSILAKKDITVLSEYEGGAAFLATSPNEKNTIWVFKGASFKTNYYYYSKLETAHTESKHTEYFGNDFYYFENTTAGNELEEERPLFMFVEKEKAAIYFSSLEDSLYAIGGDSTNVFPVPVNKLLKFKNGELVESHVITKTKPVVTTNYNKNYNSNSAFGTSNVKTYSPGNSITAQSLGSDYVNTDIKLVTEYSHVYYKQGRYYLGSNIIPDGIYILDKYTGELLINDDDKDAEEFGFFNGHLLLIPEDYYELEEKNSKTKLTNSQISKYTVHPILKDDSSFSNFVHNGKSNLNFKFATFFSREWLLTLNNGILVDKKLTTYNVFKTESVNNTSYIISGERYESLEFDNEIKAIVDVDYDVENILEENACVYELFKLL